MKRWHKGLITIAGLAALAGTYWAGANGRPETVAVAAPPPLGIAVPTIIAPPTLGPAVSVENPTGVLLGEVKVPADLLRHQPPAATPNFIVPVIVK